jgi:FKBP12-rapamycin complex-associated protein
MLKFKVQTICLHLLQLLLPANEPPSIIDKIFKILNMVQEYNESFLHLILPSFCRILNSCKNVENVMFIKGIIKYIQSILDFDLALQHMSSIVHCLIRAITDRDDVREEAKECIIALVLAFKDDALIYLPLINAAFNTNGMKNDPKFKIITDKLKLNGDLEDLDTLEDNFSKRGGDSGGANTHAYQPMSGKDLKGTESPQKTIETIRHFNSESVKNLFDVSSNFLKEDWEEWLTKTSNELIINSPSKVLFCCKSFANVNPNIAKDLFNVGFAMIWSQFNDSQKCLVIQNIEQAINNPNVPLTVLKTILNLAEFMEHDNQGLQLDITSMAKLAEKCNAHAKALYYREFEFNFCPDESIESLISLYSSLGQPEAASGMLVFAKNVLGTKVKESWLEALGRWDEALEGYNAVETRTRDDKVNNLKDKIRCYDALAQWELVLEKSDEFVKDGFELGEIAHYASRASIQLGRWSQLEKFAEKVNSRKEDNNYFDAIMAINMKDYKSAKLAIKKSRKYLENFLVGINRQTYFNNYDKLVRLQILAEMEEIIAFKDFINSVTGDNSIDGSNYEATSSEKLIEKKKMELLELWSDRLEGIEKNLFYWLEVVSVRTLLFKKSEMMPLMFRFAQLAIQKRKLGLCQRIFLELEEEMTNLKDAEALFMVSAPQTPVSIPPSPEPSRRPLLIALPSQINVTSRQESIRGLEFPPEFQLSKFEKMYMLKELNNEQIYESIKEYFETANVGDTLRGKYCRKLGQWLTESLTDDSPKGYDRVLELFRESLHFNNKVPKTWHLFALTNYKRVLQLTSNKSPVEENRSALQGFVMDAVRGFIQSISLGGPEFTETLQDTLKLLELWFKFGSDSSVRAAVGESFSKIDLTCWLNVVPQLIAKLDMNNFVVLTHVLELLLYVGEKYPQGVIFQLMLASQSKTESRKKSAQQVIDKLRERHPRFIAEAVTIANELHKVAIWQEEEWLEAINEAMTYQAEGKYDLVAKIFLDLHSKMDTPPESQIEMFFYEKYGNMLKEAENLLLHYKKYQDPMAMYQAFEYYIQLQSVLEKSMKDLETIHLKNTSPKLLKIKNSKVVIPGLYDPKQPQVFISGFYDILELMASKRKPRRMKIFGSDGKSYDFLLKGHEDLRQDERVMQSLTLVNTLLKKNENTVKKNLSIITYPVIPLSTNIGLLGWVQGCDTLQQLIKDFRTANHIIKTSELVIMGSQCPNYQIVSFPHKVEVFRYIMDSTKGDDLKKVLWIKSENAEVWLEKRTNYARSLATMSMVG